MEWNFLLISFNQKSSQIQYLLLESMFYQENLVIIFILRKKKSTSLVGKSNADLDEIIRSHHLSASTIQSFFSVDQEERSRAGLAILTSENQKLVEEICDRLTNE